MITTRLFLETAGFVRPDLVTGSIALRPMLKAGTVIAPVMFFLKMPTAARLLFKPAGFVRPDIGAASIAVSVLRGFPFGRPMLQTRPIIAPIPLFLLPPLAMCPLFQALRVLRIENGIERADDPVHVLR